MNSILENNLLKVEVSSFGAELQSITSKVSGYEYLWQGDPAFWKRRSPVLFPIVGALWNGAFMGHKTKRVKWNRPDDGESLLISAR